jgi:hypothetical protein
MFDKPWKRLILTISTWVLCRHFQVNFEGNARIFYSLHIASGLCHFPRWLVLSIRGTPLISSLVMSLTIVLSNIFISVLLVKRQLSFTWNYFSIIDIHVISNYAKKIIISLVICIIKTCFLKLLQRENQQYIDLLHGSLQVLLEKLRVSQLAKICPPFMKPASLWPRSQDSAIGSYLDDSRSNHHYQNLFHWDPLWYNPRI